MFFAIVLILIKDTNYWYFTKGLMKLSKSINNLDLQNVEILKNPIQGLLWNSGGDFA